MSNTFLTVPDKLTLKGLASYVGSQSVNKVLNVNGLKRVPNLTKELEARNRKIQQQSYKVPWKRKAELLNSFSTDSDVFEYAAVQDDNGWKVLDQTLSFADAIAIPESVEITRYDDVLGNQTPVSNDVYWKVMNSLEETGRVSSALFNDFSTIKPATYRNSRSSGMPSSGVFQAFNVPWGDITFYSSMSKASKDIPSYPESIKDARSASYTTMPNMLYQYEPWYAYTSSGPRSLSVSFHLHRQMWTGDERDGKANELIRFMEASVYAKYSGSTVATDTCTLYIKGSPYITGIVTSVDVEWTGPIGLDGFYLEFNLTVAFSEVSTRALSYDVVKSLPLIG